MKNESMYSEKKNLMIENGYGIFRAEWSDFYIDDALHIEKIDELGMFETDEEACRQAKRDGVVFVNNMHNIPPDTYIDTPQNRDILLKFLSNKEK